MSSVLDVLALGRRGRWAQDGQTGRQPDRQRESERERERAGTKTETETDQFQTTPEHRRRD